MKILRRNILSFLLLLPLLAVFTGCSQYQKVLNSDDIQQKLELAEELYEEGSYIRALPLLQELMRYYKGTETGEKLLWYYANSEYQTGEYLLSAFHFKSLYNTYPRGEFTEQALFMHAQSLFYQSPKADLDQKATRNALDAFQLFVNRYPNSGQVAEANDLMDRLRHKLEEKALENAKLYYKIEDYKASITSLNTFLEQFPQHPERQELELLILRSHFQLAEISILSKQVQRYNDTIDFYEDFITRYPDSRFRDEADEIFENALAELNQLTTANNG